MFPDLTNVSFVGTTGVSARKLYEKYNKSYGDKLTTTLDVVDAAAHVLISDQCCHLAAVCLLFRRTGDKSKTSYSRFVHENVFSLGSTELCKCKLLKSDK